MEVKLINHNNDYSKEDQLNINAKNSLSNFSNYNNNSKRKSVGLKEEKEEISEAKENSIVAEENKLKFFFSNLLKGNLTNLQSNKESKSEVRKSRILKTNFNYISSDKLLKNHPYYNKFVGNTRSKTKRTTKLFDNDESNNNKLNILDSSEDSDYYEALSLNITKKNSDTQSNDSFCEKKESKKKDEISYIMDFNSDGFNFKGYDFNHLNNNGLTYNSVSNINSGFNSRDNYNINYNCSSSLNCNNYATSRTMVGEVNTQKKSSNNIINAMYEDYKRNTLINLKADQSRIPRDKNKAINMTNKNNISNSNSEVNSSDLSQSKDTSNKIEKKSDSNNLVNLSNTSQSQKLKYQTKNRNSRFFNKKSNINYTNFAISKDLIRQKYEIFKKLQNESKQSIINSTDSLKSKIYFYFKNEEKSKGYIEKTKSLFKNIEYAEKLIFDKDENFLKNDLADKKPVSWLNFFAKIMETKNIDNKKFLLLSELKKKIQKNENLNNNLNGNINGGVLDNTDLYSHNCEYLLTNNSRFNDKFYDNDNKRSKNNIIFRKSNEFGITGLTGLTCNSKNSNISSSPVNTRSSILKLKKNISSSYNFNENHTSYPIHSSNKEITKDIKQYMKYHNTSNQYNYYQTIYNKKQNEEKTGGMRLSTLRDKVTFNNNNNKTKTIEKNEEQQNINKDIKTNTLKEEEKRNRFTFRELELRLGKVLGSNYFNTREENNLKRKIFNYEDSKRLVNLYHYVSNYKNKKIIALCKNKYALTKEEKEQQKKKNYKDILRKGTTIKNFYSKLFTYNNQLNNIANSGSLFKCNSNERQSKACFYRKQGKNNDKSEYKSNSKIAKSANNSFRKNTNTSGNMNNNILVLGKNYSNLEKSNKNKTDSPSFNSVNLKNRACSDNFNRNNGLLEESKLIAHNNKNFNDIKGDTIEENDKYINISDYNHHKESNCNLNDINDIRRNSSQDDSKKRSNSLYSLFKKDRLAQEKNDKSNIDEYYNLKQDSINNNEEYTENNINYNNNKNNIIEDNYEYHNFLKQTTSNQVNYIKQKYIVQNSVLSLKNNTNKNNLNLPHNNMSLFSVIKKNNSLKSVKSVDSNAIPNLKNKNENCLYYNERIKSEFNIKEEDLSEIDEISNELSINKRRNSQNKNPNNSEYKLTINNEIVLKHDKNDNYDKHRDNSSTKRVLINTSNNCNLKDKDGTIFIKNENQSSNNNRIIGGNKYKRNREKTNINSCNFNQHDNTNIINSLLSGSNHKSIDNKEKDRLKIIEKLKIQIKQDRINDERKLSRQQTVSNFSGLNLLKFNSIYHSNVSNKIKNIKYSDSKLNIADSNNTFKYNTKSNCNIYNSSKSYLPISNYISNVNSFKNKDNNYHSNTDKLIDNNDISDYYLLMSPKKFNINYNKNLTLNNYNNKLSQNNNKIKGLKVSNKCANSNYDRASTLFNSPSVFKANFRFHNRYNKKKKNINTLEECASSNFNKKSGHYGNFLKKIKAKAKQKYKLIGGDFKEKSFDTIANLMRVMSPSK